MSRPGICLAMILLLGTGAVAQGLFGVPSATPALDGGLRVFATSGYGSIDILDARLLRLGYGPPASLESWSNPGDESLAVSPDGRYVYVRDDSPTPVHCFDTATAPPTLVGSVSYTTTTVFRPNLVLTSDGKTGYFIESGGVVSFDADPSSATFMDVTGTAATTMNGIQGIAITPDDSLLTVVGGHVPMPGTPSVMMILTTSPFVEAATVVLTEPAVLLFNFSIREPVAVSRDGKWAGTIVQAAASFSTSILNIVGVQPSFPTFLFEVAAVHLPRTNHKDMVFSSDGLTVFTIDIDLNGQLYLTAIEWASGTIRETPVGATDLLSNFNGSVALSPDGSLVFVAIPSADVVKVYDAATLRLISSNPVSSAGGVSRIRFAGQ